MKRANVVLPGFLSLLLLSCGRPAPVAPQPSVLARASQGELTVELTSFNPLVVGQNHIFYRVLHEGQPAPHAELMQHPMMAQQACPLQNPEHAPNADGLFPGLLVFTEPGEWDLSLEVELEHGAAVDLDLGVVSVADSSMKKVLRRDGKEVVLTLGSPAPLRVGENEVVVTAHQPVDLTMMDYAPVEDLRFTLSTGDGSPVTPTLGADGLYRGTITFRTAGEWTLQLGVSAGSTELANFDFIVDL